jgi:hypothetical protein
MCKYINRLTGNFFNKAKTLQFFLRNKEESLKKLIISLYGYIKKNNKET